MGCEKKTRRRDRQTVFLKLGRKKLQQKDKRSAKNSKKKKGPNLRGSSGTPTLPELKRDRGRRDTAKKFLSAKQQGEEKRASRCGQERSGEGNQENTHLPSPLKKNLEGKRKRKKLGVSRFVNSGALYSHI